MAGIEKPLSQKCFTFLPALLSRRAKQEVNLSVISQRLMPALLSRRAKNLSNAYCIKPKTGEQNEKQFSTFPSPAKGRWQNF